VGGVKKIPCSFFTVLDNDFVNSTLNALNDDAVLKDDAADDIF
jgi:hypothetical protein